MAVCHKGLGTAGPAFVSTVLTTACGYGSTMSRVRTILLGLAAMAGAGGVSGCGDGPADPPAPPADPPRPTTVTVIPATAELTAFGETVQLRAEVRDQNGQAIAGASMTWASNATAVATVGAAGLVAAAGNGTAMITASAGGASGTAAVTVAQTVSTVAVTPAADTLVTGDTLRLAAEATDANGHPVAGAEFAWASADTAVAVVDATGLVTGVGAGEVDITAAWSGVTGLATLVVTAPAPTTVAVTPDTLAFTALGDTLRVMAAVRDQLGRVMEREPVAWASGDTLVATVDSTGLVTAAANGTASITATAREASGTTVVTVMQSVASVTVSPSAGTIAPGDTLRLEAEALDENGHRVTETFFAWSSNDTTLATVESSGLVRAVDEGMATITATAEDAHGTAVVTVANPDRAALEALYRATDGPNWVNADNWLTDAPLKEWYGVNTDVFGRVVGLDLSGRWYSEEGRVVQHGLKGSIPPQLATLGRLKRLSLIFNSLTGPIPAEIGKLGDLTELSLTSNNLAGPIPPELGNLTQLKALHLDGNGFSGPIPPELGRLANLESLGVEFNSLTGPIPAELGRLANLRVLWLWNNRLTGPIPPELGRLVNLEGLDVSNNSLRGPIPQSLLKLAGLTVLKFGNNRDLCVPGTSAFVRWMDGAEYRDETPTPYCNESDAQVLDSLYLTAGGPGWTNSTGWRAANPVLEERHGVDADSLGLVTALDLSNNGLSGTLPVLLSELTSLTVLRVTGNEGLSGRLPLALTALSLREFHYADTALCTPANRSFHEWLEGIASHEGTGEECGFAFLRLEIADTDPLTSAGATVELSVTGIADDGNQPLDNALVEWQSSDTAVATVSEGVVTAARGGYTTITASYEEHTAETAVGVWISTMRAPSVRVLYVVPADKEFRADYNEAISKAIVDVQAWYRRQLDGATYDLYSVVPERCHLPRDEDYYRHEETWARVETDVQRNCAPVWDEGRTPYSWALYVDVHESCDGEQQLGAGADRVTMLPGYDLALMAAGGGRWTFCDVGNIYRSYGSVLGGFAHELAHTFLIPHPPECDPVVTQACDPRLLMAFGWEIYPDTYFSETEKEMLRKSRFIRKR